MITVVVALGVLFVGGVTIAVIPPTGAVTVSISRNTMRRRVRRLLGAAGVAATIIAVSGWIAPGIVIGLGAYWAIGGWQRRQRSADAEIARLDALASWVESVRDVLMAGEQPIGAIAASVNACSGPMRPAVRRLAAGSGVARARCRC
jgi:hypothetical protein